MNYSQGVFKPFHILNHCDALGDLVPFVQFKNVKNRHGGVLLSVSKVSVNTPPWVFFMFFELYKHYQSRNVSHRSCLDKTDSGMLTNI